MQKFTFGADEEHKGKFSSIGAKKLAWLQMNLCLNKNSNLWIHVDEMLKIELRKPIKSGIYHQKGCVAMPYFSQFVLKTACKNKFMFICTFAYVIALIYRWKNHTNKCC